MQQRTSNFYMLRASGLNGPALWAGGVYCFMVGCCCSWMSVSDTNSIYGWGRSNRAECSWTNLEASYDIGMFKVTELFSMIHSTVCVSVWRLHDCVSDVMHLLAMDVTKTPEPYNSVGCLHTFGHITYDTLQHYRLLQGINSTLDQHLYGPSLTPTRPERWWMEHDISPIQTKPATDKNIIFIYTYSIL